MNESVLDDPEALEAADPGEMLRAVASSGAQVREAAHRTRETDLGQLTAEGQPRSIVVTGMGGSGIAGDVLAGLAGTSCRIPIVTVRGYSLPGWVGPVDMVIGVSCSGTTEETMAVVEEAARRGCRLVTVGAAGSPLASVSEQQKGLHVPVNAAGRLPRANIWALSVPLLVIGDALGLLSVPDRILAAAADLLDNISSRCRPSSDSFVNPAKLLAAELAGTVPMLWGSSELAGVAAYRFACQLNENSKYPAVYGVLPEANHNQVVVFDGPFGGEASQAPVDFFRDRVEDSEGESAAAHRLRLVLLRDSSEHPQVARRGEVSRELAEARGIPVTELVAEGEHPLERLASLVALTDFATVYLALILGIDPTPIASISELKERIAQ
jgi:glucose/mannose-6-phosphate isomerase